MIEKTPTEDEYQPCEFHACMQECISARRHVAIENQLYTHEIVIKQAIPNVNEYDSLWVRLEQALKIYGYSM